MQAHPFRRMLSLLAVLAAVTSGLACDSIYYKTMKKFGMEKRDILVKRVREAREAQQEGKEEFRSALDKIPQAQREALSRVGASGFSYADGAAVCGCGVGTQTTSLPSCPDCGS